MFTYFSYGLIVLKLSETVQICTKGNNLLVLAWILGEKIEKLAVGEVTY
jgi:hypothetical protein